MGERTTGSWPTGTVTFLITDIEASTSLYQTLGSAFEGLLDEHRTICRSAFESRGGMEMSCPGDGFHVVFANASDAVEAAVEIQQRMTAHTWPDDAVLRVRAGVHTGEASLTTTGGTYVGLSLHEAARVAAAGHGGQVVLSEGTWRLVEHQLPVDLGARPLGAHQLAGLDGRRALFQLEGPGLVSTFPALRTETDVLGNLPGSTTELLGRADQLAVLVAAVPARSLTTVVGPGGMGKTRLAIEVGRSVAERFDDGVWFVDLAAIASPSDPDQLSAAIGRALNLDVGGAKALARALRGRRAMLVLDNCEHVLEALTEVVEGLLAAAPSVRMLATSRERLGLAGEQVLALGPLPEAPSIALFLTRAREVVPDFEPDGEDREAVEQICARLDGMPLAIELAAKRVSVLAPADILERLDDRFALLTGGGRRAPDRHRTLEATLDWSYSMLTEAEQTVLRRLSVFVGGCTLAAAQEVCRGGVVGEDEVLDVIAALVERSLVRVQRSGQGVRYDLLETVRAYAAARRDASGEADDVRDRHLGWCASVSWGAADGILTSRSSVDFEGLAREGDNLRASVDWARAGGDLDDGLRTAAGMGLHGFETGTGFSASAAWVAELLAAGAGADDPELRARALFSAANVAAALGDRDALLRHGEEMLTLVERFELPAEVQGAALMTLGLARSDDAPRAFALLWEGVALLASAGTTGLSSIGCSLLCEVALAVGEIETAVLAAERALDAGRRAGAPMAIARALSQLAAVAMEQGEAQVAMERSVEAVAVARAAGVGTELAIALIAQSRAADELGDRSAAAALLLEAAARFSELGFASPLRRLWASVGESQIRLGDEVAAAWAVRRLVDAMGDAPFDPASDPAAHRAIVRLLEVADEHERADLVRLVRDRLPSASSG